MEIKSESSNKVYEVEKIINCKLYKNKKYYLIKWLCYPIPESTWEPKANIKHLSSMLKKFDANFPNSIDRDMYNIYCTANKKSRKKRSKKVSKNKEIKICTKSLSKTRKIEGFSKSELKDIYYEKLKNHFFINIVKRHINKPENQVVIDLSSNSTSHSEDNLSIFINEKDDAKESEETNEKNKLIRPILE